MEYQKRKRTNHTAAFKREAVEFVLSSDRSAPQIAAELGVSVSNLRRWKREYQDRASMHFLAKVVYQPMKRKYAVSVAN